eukprot:TRINITY_DN782079_c0_g1_i1.p1 TRINITY_DN782079_c0_g1~~TRINITY_DN782079_c0_g1_i1.p1  ORF type:complete len:181 (-),score=16.83 TRINITY_DN782079_c0_g1_i1:243-785(-)
MKDCADIDTCNSCITEPHCGFCRPDDSTELGLCLPGSLSHPTDRSACAHGTWRFEGCLTCADYDSCSSCLEHSACGYCGTKVNPKCFPGDVWGPYKWTGESCKSQNWFKDVGYCPEVELYFYVMISLYVFCFCVINLLLFRLSRFCLKRTENCCRKNDDDTDSVIDADYHIIGSEYHSLV